LCVEAAQTNLLVWTEPVWILVMVDKFCYLDDMLSVHGDADAVVEDRVREG